MFQAFMNYNFSDYIHDGWLVIYMDDQAIGADSLEDEEWKVCLILQWFWDLRLSLKLSKYKFGKLEIEFLGMIVGSGCIHMDPAKLSAIATWPLLKMVKAVHSFLGFCNFYCKFIPGFSNIVALLTALMHKNQPWCWDPVHQAAFDTLLQKFQTAPVLCLPDVCRSFVVMTDASLLVNRGVLMQWDENGDLHPCAYLSQTFAPAERNYDIYNQELLTIIHALDHWRQYLQGTEHPVTLLTDHKNLMYFHQPWKLSRWQAQWMLFLQGFNLTFIHMPSIAMGPADALSCLSDLDVSLNNTNVMLLPDDLFICAIKIVLTSRIAASSSTDPLVLNAVQSLHHNSSFFPHSSPNDWYFDWPEWTVYW